MTGPEHYLEAERLLGSLDRVMAAAERAKTSTKIAGVALAQVTAEAQVHATLAMAAATAAVQATGYDGDEDHSRSRAWAGVL